MSLSECIRCGGFIPLGPNATNCCTRCGFHIFGEQPDWKARAEKAEAEVERLRALCHELLNTFGNACPGDDLGVLADICDRIEAVAGRGEGKA